MTNDWDGDQVVWELLGAGFAMYEATWLLYVPEDRFWELDDQDDIFQKQNTWGLG